MGPGSENIIIKHHQHYQHLPNAVLINCSRKPNGKSNPSWFYDQMRNAVSTYDSGKVHHRQTTKPARKSSNSPQQFHAKSKPMAVMRSFSHSESTDKQTNLRNRLTPDNMGGKHHTRSSPVKGLPLAGSPRQMSLTPPNLYSQSMNSQSPPKAITPTGKSFYAGAKFETHPSHRVLPSPPSHWTVPITRSQSQPSSPTLKSMQKGTAIDLASLFGSSSPISMANSFPGERMMQALVKAEEMKQRSLESSDVSSDEELKEVVKEAKKAVDKKEATLSDPKLTSGTGELKKALELNSTPGKNTKLDLGLSLMNQTCHGALTPPKNYQAMSDQLKSLMKVAA